MEPYQELEAAWARWNGLDPGNVVGVASGTAALHLGLEALRLPPGSEVITSTFNMIAVPRAIVMAGLVPVFVDCGEDLLMDLGCFREAVRRSTEAAVFTHVYGRRCHFPDTWDRYSPSLRVVEDLAEAHGVKPHPATDAAAWSFFRNKVVACPDGEGGAVAFRDPEHARLARSLRSLGFTPDHDFRHLPRGHNYRLSNAHAALILPNLARADELLAERRLIESWYDAVCPDEWRMPKRDVCWVMDIRIPGMTRDTQTRVVKALNAEGIAARHSFLPMHLQEEFRHCRRVGGEVAERMANEVFYLPVAPGSTTPASVRHAFAIIRTALG